MRVLKTEMQMKLLFFPKIGLSLLHKIQLSFNSIFLNVGFILEFRKIIRKKQSEDHIWPIFLIRGLIFSLHKVKQRDHSISVKEKLFRTSHSEVKYRSVETARGFAHPSPQKGVYSRNYPIRAGNRRNTLSRKLAVLY